MTEPAAPTPCLAPPPTASRIHARLREAGHQAFFCGGCVRDALLGSVPKDWDITTSATPDEIEALFEHTVPVGKSFGVIIVVEAGVHYEVATFRADLPSADGRRPTGVRFTSAEEDVKRRDFTINALLYDPETDSLLDYVGGQADMQARRLRTVGDPEARFLEDHLRLLRAVRFAARTGFTLENETRRAMGDLAGLVRNLSGERVGSEIAQILCEGRARAAFVLLQETGLLRHLLPEVDALRGVPQPKAFHPEGDVWTHTLLMLGLLGGSSPEAPTDLDDADEILGWAVLLHDIGKPDTLTVSDRIRFNHHDQLGAELAEGILRRMKRPVKTITAVCELIGRHMHFCALPEMRQSKVRRFVRDPLFPLHLQLHRLDCLGSHQMLGPYAFGLDAWRAEQARPPEPEPLLTGRDLMALGYPPGPRMGTILNAVEDARLEGELETQDAARSWVRETFPPEAEQE